MIWGNLLHLSYNMWSDVPLRPGEKPFEDRTTWYEPDWLFDEALWNELTEAMAAAGQQREFEYAVMRQHDLWWHDLRFMIDNVTRAGARAWVWSDPAWRHPDTFYERMPKDVVQSNWYYGTTFEGDESGRPKVLEGTDHYLAYLDLDEHGYEQVPTGSSWRGVWDCFGLTVDFCRRRLSEDRLLGYLQTSWRPTVPYWRDTHLKTIDLVRQAKDALG